MEQILEVRAAVFADDVPAHDAMTQWKISDVEVFFESGGKIFPGGGTEVDVCDAAASAVDVVGDSVDASIERDEQPEPVPACSAHQAATPPPSTDPALPVAAANIMDTPRACDEQQAAVHTSPAELAGGATSGLENELSNLSIKQLKARCTAAGLSTDDCLAKADLIKRALEASNADVAKSPSTSAPASSSAAENWWDSLSTKDIKRRLAHHGVDTSACYERSDFEALARRHPCSAEPSAATSQQVREDYWSTYSIKQLRQLLNERHVSTTGCLDKADLLATADKHRAVLLAAVPTGGSSGQVGSEAGRQLNPRQAQLEREKKEKIRAGLEALGGVVHGGYQIDMFGTKRGRCVQNPKCFRYLPGNHKLNGCAMKGMGAVTCRRCGFQNMDHEDLGRWEEGDPMLVDEHGDGWKFENGVDGVRRVKMEPPGRARRGP